MSAVDSSLAARGRLAVLSAHLAASIDRRELEAAPIIEPSCTSAQNSVPPPGNLRGTLTVIDERTGKKYPVAVSEEGTVKAIDLKKVRVLSESLVEVSRVPEGYLFDRRLS